MRGLLMGTAGAALSKSPRLLIQSFAPAPRGAMLLRSFPFLPRICPVIALAPDRGFCLSRLLLPCPRHEHLPPYPVFKKFRNFFKKVLTNNSDTVIMQKLSGTANRIWGYSSAGRALEWHSRGQRFDPAYLHHKSFEIYGFRSFFLFILCRFVCIFHLWVLTCNTSDPNLTQKTVSLHGLICTPWIFWQQITIRTRFTFYLLRNPQRNH